MRAVEASLDRRSRLRVEPLERLQALENFRDLILTQAGDLRRRRGATIRGRSDRPGRSRAARRGLAWGRGRSLLVVAADVFSCGGGMRPPAAGRYR